MSEPSGKKLDELYKFAWTKGLKTTYYLRTMGATHAEKSTISDDRLNKVRGAAGSSVTAASAANGAAPKATAASPSPEPEVEMPKACSILDPDCEACQ